MNAVCVLMSTYNGERFIREQIDSIMNQVGVDVYLIVRDDSSSDSTCSIVEDYITAYPNRIELLRGNNLGFALSFSELIKYSLKKHPKCNYFAFADQDDVWLENKLLVAVEALEKENSTLPIAYCSNKTLVDENLAYIRTSWKRKEVRLSKERSMIQSFATGCTMVFNRVAAEMYIAHIPEQLKVHDYLMYQQCMFLGKVIYDHNSYILYRQHGTNQIGNPGFKKRMQRRLSGHYKEHALEEQNYFFLKAYKDILSVDDVGLLSLFVFYRRNFLTRLSLLFNNKIKYTTFEANFFYVLKVIIGGV